MKIKKIKILKDVVSVTFTERKEDGTIKSVTEDHETKPHPDLLQSLANLRAHFGLLTGYIPSKSIKKIETPAEDLVESFNVYALSVKTGDDEGVVISGQKTLENGKKVTVNTPFTRFTEGEESAYKFTDDLIQKVERANKEIESFLDGSKKADDPQGKLFEQAPTLPPASGTRNTDTEDAELVEEGGDAEVWKDGKRPNL